MNRSVSDGAVLGAIGCVLALGVLLWLWGGVAGLLFGAGWPRVGPGELARVALRLPARLGDPARAWPTAEQRRLPGPPGFYASLPVLGALALLVARALQAAALGRERHGARWADQRELRTLRGRRRRSGRLVLGRRRGRPLYAEQRHALVVFGPPQSGKSSGLAIPALLEWQGPAVASSIKTDLLAATLRRRERLGEVMIFDPFGLSGQPSHSWSPLREARTWDGALEVASRLAAAGELEGRGV